MILVVGRRRQDEGQLWREEEKERREGRMNGEEGIRRRKMDIRRR